MFLATDESPTPRKTGREYLYARVFYSVADSRGVYAVTPLFPGCPFDTGFAVELSEIQQIRDYSARGEFARSSVYTIRDRFGGVDPVDADCPASDQCAGALTRVGIAASMLGYCTRVSPSVSREIRQRKLLWV